MFDNAGVCVCRQPGPQTMEAILADLAETEKASSGCGSVRFAPLPGHLALRAAVGGDQSESAIVPCSLSAVRDIVELLSNHAAFRGDRRSSTASLDRFGQFDQPEEFRAVAVGIVALAARRAR
jgi:hypothetical protein